MDKSASANADWWLVCNHAAPFLVARFEPASLCMARTSGRVYHAFGGFETLDARASHRLSATGSVTASGDVTASEGPNVSASSAAIARAIGGVALVRSALAQELSAHFRWAAAGSSSSGEGGGGGRALDATATAEETLAMLAERGPPTHFLWRGRLHALNNQLWKPRVANVRRAPQSTS